MDSALRRIERSEESMFAGQMSAAIDAARPSASALPGAPPSTDSGAASTSVPPPPAGARSAARAPERLPPAGGQEWWLYAAEGGAGSARTSLRGFRNREAAFALAVFLARYWSAPGGSSSPSRSIAGRSTSTASSGSARRGCAARSARSTGSAISTGSS